MSCRRGGWTAPARRVMGAGGQRLDDSADWSGFRRQQRGVEAVPPSMLQRAPEYIRRRHGSPERALGYYPEMLDGAAAESLDVEETRLAREAELEAAARDLALLEQEVDEENRADELRLRQLQDWQDQQAEIDEAAAIAYEEAAELHEQAESVYDAGLIDREMRERERRHHIGERARARDRRHTAAQMYGAGGVTPRRVELSLDDL